MALTLMLTGCQTAAPSTPNASSSADVNATHIELSDEAILVNGQAAPTDETAAVYTANDIVFYLAGQDFTYGEGTEADAHEQSEADGHTVVHITQPGTYSLSGTLSQGQVAVDLGGEAEEDPNAVVTLILDGVDITCTVAPGVIFYNVYECGTTDTEAATQTVDTSAAGANVIIADGSTNTVNGSYVARIYKHGTVELSEGGTEVADAKKLHKYDAAFYSKMSMNVTGGETGSGVLNINAENEGLDSELHLTLNGGNVNITSGNDGINTNEDGVSVTTINGGNLNIVVDGATGEGDGIDSNGWLVINGGTVSASACAFSGDAGIDSDMGIHINGGTVMATGNMLDRIADSQQNYAVFTFAQQQDGGNTYTLKNAAGEAVAECSPTNRFTYLIFSGAAMEPGAYTLWQGDQQLAGSSSASFGMGGGFPGGGQRPGMPEGEMPELPEGVEPGQRPERPDGTEFPEGEMPEGTQPGQRPELPEGMEFPEGEMPELSEGAEPGRGGMGGRPGGMQSAENLSTEFAIAKGGSYFSFVSPAE